MMLFSSLRGRIFLTSALLAVFSVGAAIYLVSVRITREAESALQREIASTARLVEQLRTTRARNVMTLARLIADTPRLKAALDTNDPPTVQDTADDYRRQLDSSLLLLTSKTGQVLATVGASPRAGLVMASQPSVRAALAGHEGVSLLPQPDGILHLVTVPITIGLAHPEILGTLSIGFLLDDTFAQQLKEITGSDIAFGIDGQILASTRPREDHEALSGALDSGPSPHDVSLGAGEFIALPLTLEAAGTGGTDRGPVALILRSRTEQLRVLRTIHTELAVTALVAVLLATLLSFGVARTITRPLAAITGVMRDVAATGDLTRKIVLRRGQRWTDEDARLLATTFNTLTDSIARAQREVSQRERLSSLGRLSTVIAHEVRNPLMIIKAALHTIRQPGLPADALLEAAADIDEEVDRLNRIVNEVLDFARPIRFETAPTDVNGLCRESAQAAAATPGAPVDLKLDPTVPVLDTDGERLRVALVNLIVNARHAAEGRGTPVVLSTRRQEGTVAIIVGDQGSGIDHADLPRIFDPFFTTKRGGTGLGLPIAKNIVEGLGGSIRIASEPSRGTEITVELPLEGVNAAAGAGRARPAGSARRSVA